MGNLPQGPRTPGELYRETRRAASLALAVTLALGLAKLAAGWFGHSLALLSDSVHSLGDALCAGSILGALWWAEQPPDREHPYGHTRIESIAASHIAVLLLLSGLWVGAQAIRTWGEPRRVPHLYTLLVALASVVLNEAIFHYTVRVARRTGSKAMEASAWDQRLDVFGSMVVLLGLALNIWGGPSFHFVDHVAALAVGIIIVWAGASLFWGSMQDLMDREADLDVLDTIRRVALSVPGVRGVEKIHARKAGLEYLVDIHVEVDANVSVRDGHQIGHAVKDRLVTDLVTIKDVLVHIEPSPHSPPSTITPSAEELV